MEIVNPYGFIYITTNLINGMKYIGQKKLKKDWKYYLGSGICLTRAIKNYGRKNFHRDIIAIAYSKEELDSLEIEFIKLHNACENNNYYNIAIGGSNGNYMNGKTEEEKKEIKHKISDSLKGENSYLSKKVVCLNTEKVFSCMTEAGEYYNTHCSSIASCCKNQRNYSGIHPVTKEQLKWVYYEDYIKMSEADIKNKLKKHVQGSKIICLNTFEVFETAKSAGEKYKCAYQHITSCCTGKRKSSGKHAITGEKLQWMYYKDYIDEIKNKKLISGGNKK